MRSPPRALLCEKPMALDTRRRKRGALLPTRGWSPCSLHVPFARAHHGKELIVGGTFGRISPCRPTYVSAYLAAFAAWWRSPGKLRRARAAGPEPRSHLSTSRVVARRGTLCASDSVSPER